MDNNHVKGVVLMDLLKAFASISHYFLEKQKQKKAATTTKKKHDGLDVHTITSLFIYLKNLNELSNLAICQVYLLLLFWLLHRLTYYRQFCSIISLTICFCCKITHRKTWWMAQHFTRNNSWNVLIRRKKTEII